MATIKIYLDDRAAKKKNVQATVKIHISHRNTSCLWNLNVKIKPEEWNKANKSTNWIYKRPDANILNTMIQDKYTSLLVLISELQAKRKLSSMTASDIRDMIDGQINGKIISDATLVAPFFEDFINKRKADNTKSGYRVVLTLLREHDEKFDKRTWDDMTYKYIRELHVWMEKRGLRVNTISKYMMHFHSVVNAAIDDELAIKDPFRKYKFETEETMKRSLTVAELRKLFTAEVGEKYQKALDVFKIMFMLIGVNTVDLMKLQKVTSDNRIVYRRSKTGKIYNIKLEPEIIYIINKYKTKKKLVDLSDYGADAHTVCTNLIRDLKVISEIAGIPTITPYWSRHSWATAAAELDIPKTTISASLGHGSKTITDIYIDRDSRKVDVANRLVLDWVLYGKFKLWTKAMDEIRAEVEAEKAKGIDIITINGVG